MKLLSIGIPTYNRKEELLRLLHSIEKDHYQLLEEVFICDNCSDYDVQQAVRQSVSSDFFKLIRIIRNRVNIGGHGNIKNLFLHCRTKWLWMIGDDDVVEPGCINNIAEDIETDPDCAQFRYSINTIIKGKRLQVYEDDYEMSSLQDFIDYYERKERHKGNLVFMSNNVINVEALSPYIHYAYTYNVPVSQIIPAIMGLDEGKVRINYRKKIVCNYIHPDVGTQWNVLRVLVAMTNMCQLPYKSLREKNMYRLMGVFNFMPVCDFTDWCFSHKSIINDTRQISYICRNLYKYGPKRNRISRFGYFFFIIQYKIGFPAYRIYRSVKRRLHLN